MSTIIPASILGLPGQCVNQIHEKEDGSILIEYHRDRRIKPIDPVTGKQGTVNRYVRRLIQDLPFLHCPCFLEIEQAQVHIEKNQRRMESLSFVDPYQRYTKRFCQLVSGLCRHMSIQAVSLHLGIRWETTKNMDKAYLRESLPALHPEELTNLKWIGVDEVARAKGHDYMTVVYDLEHGNLIWVHEGRTSETLSLFLTALPEETAQNIEAVAMDMGPAFRKAVKEHLPQAAIIFDRFHVMQNYSKVIRNQRRIEFRRASRKEDQALIKGSLYLLLKNPEKLKPGQQEKLDSLRNSNDNLNLIYMLKEQLQQLWVQPESFDIIKKRLESWCQLADESGLHYLKKFAKSLRRHATGICNYAKFPLTTARIEAGNVAIGMIRKRARGIRDTEYFKLKIRQVSIPDQPSMFYQNTC